MWKRGTGSCSLSGWARSRRVGRSGSPAGPGIGGGPSAAGWRRSSSPRPRGRTGTSRRWRADGSPRCTVRSSGSARSPAGSAGRPRR
jgi:hypothetical protein